MVKFELKLGVCRHLLSKINSYEKLISDKGYERLDTSNYYKKWFTPLRNSIEGEIKQILESLKAEGIDNPEKTFSYGEVIDCLQNETELKGFRDSISQISAEIFKEAESSEVDIIRIFDCLPEWLFPTSTASVESDVRDIESFVSIENCVSDIDNFFNTLMNSERINKTLTSWKEQKKLVKRLPIIEEAIEAHLAGKYYLSVSTLISQVEGLLRDPLEDAKLNHDFNSMRKEDVRRATTTLVNKTNESLEPFNLKATSLLKSLPNAVADLYEEYKQPENTIQGKLYRHGVCHGRQTDFGTKKNSLRLILLLDRIIFFYAMT